jgi:hypothetical protein
MNVQGRQCSTPNSIAANCASLLAGFLAFAFALPLSAMDSTEVLPESINSPSIRMGVVSGIGMKFLSNGDLMSLGDLNSIEFNISNLRQFEPRVNELVAVLNQFGSQRLGDQLSLGVLRVDTTPEVRYLAPVYAIGLTKQWTVGFGLPILQYKNRIRLQQSGSNLDAIRAEVGNASTDLNQAFDQLSVDLAVVAQDQLVKKGYKPLTDRDESQIGDLQLVSLVQMNKEEKFSTQLKTLLSVPTGQGDDPDDLADLGAYGYTAIENQLLGNYHLTGKWKAAAKFGYRYTLPDRVVRRVPMNEADTLPGPETKQTVNRRTGDALFGGGSLTYSFSQELDIGLGWEFNRKSGDAYTGSVPLRYDLIDGRDSSSDRLRFGISYSSIESFFAGKAMLPSVIAYEFSDNVSGVNVERMAIHEIWLQLFF